MSIEVELKPEDLEISYFDPNGGRGGWRLDAKIGVTVFHRPTGKVVNASSRSTAAENKAHAEFMLKEALQVDAEKARRNELGNKWLKGELTFQEQGEAILQVNSFGLSMLQVIEAGNFRIDPENRLIAEAKFKRPAETVRHRSFDPAGFGFKVEPITDGSGRTVAYSLSDPNRKRTLTKADQEFNAGLEAAAALVDHQGTSEHYAIATKIRKLKRS